METWVEQGGGVPSTLQEKQERAPLREDQRLPWTLQGASEPRESGSFPVGLRRDSGHLHITEVSLSFAGQVVTFSAGRALEWAGWGCLCLCASVQARGMGK